MDNLPLQVLIPIGVVTAALIAGFFSILNLIISKEQKVSEFRQQWIDSLRQEISDHIAALVSLSAIQETGHNLDKDVAKTESELRQKVTSTFTSIKLRINPEDSDKNIRKMNQEVLRLLDEERKLFNESKWKEARVKCNEITNASIPMLKEEWKRVKRGESVYVWSKRMAVTLFTISLLALLYIGFSHWPSPGLTRAYSSPKSEHPGGEVLGKDKGEAKSAVSPAPEPAQEQKQKDVTKP
jgi:ABC-type multidrug transport system fused ATPase/permease subunit